MAGAAGKVSVKVLTMVIGIPVGIVTRKVTEKAFAAARPDAEYREAEGRRRRLEGRARRGPRSPASGFAAAELVTRRGAQEVYAVDHRQRAARATVEGAEEGAQEEAEAGPEGTRAALTYQCSVGAYEMPTISCSGEEPRHRLAPRLECARRAAGRTRPRGAPRPPPRRPRVRYLELHRCLRNRRSAGQSSDPKQAWAA